MNIIRNTERGFSLVEVMVALLLVAFGMVVLLGVIGTALDVSQQARDSNLAPLSLETIHNLAAAKAVIEENPHTNPGDWYAFTPTTSWQRYPKTTTRFHNGYAIYYRISDPSPAMQDCKKLEVKLIGEAEDKANGESGKVSRSLTTLIPPYDRGHTPFLQGVVHPGNRPGQPPYPPDSTNKLEWY